VIRRWLPVVLLLAVAALTAALGAWQLDRGAQKDALQAARDAARAGAPVAPSGPAPRLAALDGARVVLAGRFDEAGTVFLDNRTHQGVAGFHVLTPLRLDDGGAWVMVLRGWVARDLGERTRVPALPALDGPVRIEGYAQAVLAQPMLLAEQPAPAAGERIWQRYEADAYRRWSGRPVVDGVVRQASPTPDGLARDWLEPGSGADKHRGYAFQWFAMAVLAAGGAAVLGWRLRAQRDA
jgi:cytochrome oxidase assembly protein ShyY1